MSQNCKCDSKVSNLGKPDCTQTVGRPSKLVFVSKKDAAGAYNKISSTDVLTDLFIDGKVQNVNEKSRWHFSPIAKDFLSVTSDATYKSYDDETRRKIRGGVRTFTGEFPEADHNFACYLEKFKCAGFGFFLVSETNVITGYKKDESGDTYPMPIELLEASYNFESGDNIQNVTFEMEIPRTVSDCALSSIFGASGDLVGTEGLIQLSMVASSPSSTGYTVTVAGGGAYGSTVAYTGLDASDLSAVDATGSAVVIGSLTHTANGIYTIVFTAVSSADVVTVSETATLLAKGLAVNSTSETIA
tara:strand:- start:854 stop:1759 length:906 start_codon:yes stop_codon:yes gene_type:complete